MGSANPNRHESPSYLRNTPASSAAKQATGLIASNGGPGAGQVQITANASASRLSTGVQSQNQSIKISQKGSKQLSQIRGTGPVRVFQTGSSTQVATNPSSLAGQMSRMGLDKKSTAGSKTSHIGQEHPTQKPRPSSSKPV